MLVKLSYDSIGEGDGFGLIKSTGHWFQWSKDSTATLKGHLAILN